MIKQHNCDDSYIHKTITVSKVIDGETHNFSVRGNYCSVCGEILICSNELELLEKRIRAYEELMSIVKNYRELKQ